MRQGWVGGVGGSEGRGFRCGKGGVFPFAGEENSGQLRRKGGGGEGECGLCDERGGKREGNVSE